MSIQPPDVDTNFYDFILALFKQLQWLWGLLAGGLVGIYFQRIGRIRFSVLQWKVCLIAVDTKGHRIETDDPSSAVSAEIDCVLQFHNGKSSIAALRKGELLLKRGGEVVIRKQLFQHINIDPGCLETTEHAFGFDSDIDDFRRCDRVEFTALTPRGSHFTKLVARLTPSI